MKTMSKALVGTIAAGAMAVSSASPAFADSRDRGHRDGISAGEIIAGALVIGGIAAVAASAGKGDRYDARYDDYRYGRAGYDRDTRWGGSPRTAVEQCVVAAERNASRYSYGRADVTDIRQVKETRFGYEVKGRIAVNSNARGWRASDGNYGRGWGGDYRGWNSSLRGYDSGSFKCRVERGRVVDIDYSGIRGL